MKSPRKALEELETKSRSRAVVDAVALRGASKRLAGLKRLCGFFFPFFRYFNKQRVVVTSRRRSRGDRIERRKYRIAVIYVRGRSELFGLK